MINRAAVLLRYKQPAVQWINDADPVADSIEVSLDSANEERTVYLVSEEDADNPELVNLWIKKNYQSLFENELFSWYMLESLWPQKRNFALFSEWFEIECHTVIEDTAGTPILDDEL
ncbi:MAG: hypothetical protein IMF09_02980 [Proteobacteria bacterium]|nr:hypothetical protein [Pseudomonadota bacterium]